MNLKAGLAFLTPRGKKNPAFVNTLEEAGKRYGGGGPAHSGCCGKDPLPPFNGPEKRVVAPAQASKL